MTGDVRPTIFTIEMGGMPTLTFEVQNLRVAQKLCREQWLKDDQSEAKSNGVPLWDGEASLRARAALPDESAVFAEAQNNGHPSDGMMLVYLIELGGRAIEEAPFDPGAFRRPEPDPVILPSRAAFARLKPSLEPRCLSRFGCDSPFCRTVHGLNQFGARIFAASFCRGMD
jgi:hypothetical protein